MSWNSVNLHPLSPLSMNNVDCAITFIVGALFDQLVEREVCIWLSISYCEN